MPETEFLPYHPDTGTWGKPETMLPFEVRQFATRSGEQVAVLIERGAGPVFWPNVYVTGEHRQTGHSVNTSAKVLRTLGMAGMWARACGRDLDRALHQGDFLSIEQAEDLADFLRLSAEGQLASAERRRSKPTPPSNVVRLEAVRPNPRAPKPTDAKVCDPAEAAARIRWVAAYAEWHLKRRLGSLDRQRQEATNLKEVGEGAVARLRQLAPRAAAKSDDEPTLEGVDREVLLRVEAAVRPGAECNPFQPGFVQARNYLLWRLILDTGARRGEVRAAKVDHVAFAIRRFEIHTSKTIPRTVPINAKTAEAFDRFVMEHWSKLPGDARRRAWLFTDERGRHLSLRAFNRVFERLREEVPGLPNFMSPHTVRRSWNDLYSLTLDSLPADKRPAKEEEITMRNRLQGWTGTSGMAARYARRHIRRKADEVAEALTDGFTLESEGQK